MTDDEKGTTGPVLVAIDFSVDSAAALAWALRYAERSGQGLALLHVVHDPAAQPGFYRDPEQNLPQPMEAVAREMMNQFLRPLRQGALASPILEQSEQYFVPGLPPSRIVEVADLLHAEPIVVGSRGRTGMPHILLGSVAERVVELASCPVVVVKSENREKPEEEGAAPAAKQRDKKRRLLKQMLGLNSKFESKETVDD